MNTFNSILLGLLQGFTEFLPVSSSGHLVIAQSLIPNFSQPGVLFDVTLHAGTLFSVVLFFYKEIVNISRKYVYFIIVGTIPAVIIGYLFESLIEGFFGSTLLVGIALIFTGIINFYTDKISNKKKDLDMQKGLIIGLYQALAIIPGISRSGMTIFAGRKLGIDKKSAAQFSFILSIPAIIGANIFQLLKYSYAEEINLFVYFVGFMTAFVSGFYAIRLVFKFLFKGKFKYFSYYLIFAGSMTLLLLS